MKHLIKFIPIVLIIGIIIYIFSDYLNKENIDSDDKKTNESNNIAIDDDYDTSYNKNNNIDLDNLTCTNSIQKNNNIFTITNNGDYYISGTGNAQIVIDADDNDIVHLILDSANLTYDYSPIYVKKAKKVIITVLGENNISDKDNYTSDDTDATIYSKDDLVINGDGKLIINGNYQNGIVSKDSLKIINTDIKVISINTGIKGKDYVYLENTTIDITSSGDGINVAGGDGSSYDRPGSNNFSGITGTLKINGGNIVVNASGDGLDANGNIYINGGNTIIYGPTDNGNGALDYDGVLEITDGSLIASGSSGMAQMPGEDSSINSVMINFNQTITSDKVVTIKNSSDEEIINYKADKSYTNLVISNDKLSNGDYTIYIDNEKYDTFTTSGIITKVGNTQNANMMARDDMRRPR